MYLPNFSLKNFVLITNISIEQGTALQTSAQQSAKYVRTEGFLSNVLNVKIYFFQPPLRIDSFQADTSLVENNSMMKRVGK